MMKANAGWPHNFHPYSVTHLCVVAAFAAMVSAMIAMRRQEAVADDPPKRRLMDKSVGWMGLAAATFVQGATLWPTRFFYQTALPLHICDIVMFVAPLALLLRWRKLRSIAYFWGLGLSSLSFIWPDLHFGPVDFQFWVFWAGHATIVGTALYDVTGRGFRPTWVDWRTAVWFGIVYAAVIFPFDAIFHLNYGYIGRTYLGQMTPFDLLGPWPWRVPAMVLLAIAVMMMLLLPWVLTRKAAANNHNEGGNGSTEKLAPVHTVR
jgi:hypothetical integral membrane protein (TIGR02206 family)